MLDVILNHRSIRKYNSRPVEENILSEILAAGTRASTTGNMQVYSIIVTTEPEIKQKLWEAHFKQDMVLKAPVVLTFCADFHRFNIWCEQRGAVPGYDNFLSFFTAAIDALLAAQNCALAAESHGLGICYLGTTTYNGDIICRALDLPDSVLPVTTIVAGYADESPGLTDRLPLEAVVHREKYRDYTSEDIDRLYKEKESSELTKKLLLENNMTTLARIFAEKRYSKKDNLLFSQKLLDLIREKGFFNHQTVSFPQKEH